MDLGFVPVGSLFLSDWNQLDDPGAFSSLIVVDRNYDRVIQNSRRLLEEGIGTIKISWNAELSKPYSFAMISLARRTPHWNFEIHGTTAHLELAVDEAKAFSVRMTPEDMRSLLIEQFRKPSNLSVGELRLLIQDQEDLLLELEKVSLYYSEVTLENQVLQKRAAQLPLLYDKMRELQSENVRLRKRNDTLARKAFHKLSTQVKDLADQDQIRSQTLASEKEN
ncbi:hypothetical protein HF851_06705 [Corynebacterium ammoniagenes]|uniref:hypothetical protein n=1 Tax=Corynebacterium ammoniagenes TaxID=1697 RepID=UPI001459CB44|nr:hypothetical protein [Corynebacterium ammoniagenes]NMF31967.1 hypothetical protein [Corynebacterium ammoniagenes]